MNVSLRALSKYEKIPLMGSSPVEGLELFQVDTDQALLDIIRAAHNGEAVTPTFANSESAAAFEKCTCAYLYSKVPLLAQESAYSSLSSKLILNDIISFPVPVEEAKKLRQSFNKELKQFIKQVAPSIHQFHKLETKQDLWFDRLFVYFNVNKVPTFVTNHYYKYSVTSSGSTGVGSLEFDQPATTTFTLPNTDFDVSLQVKHSMLVSKGALFFNGLVESLNGDVNLIVRRSMKDLSQIFVGMFDNGDSFFDTLKHSSDHVGNNIPIAINSEVFPGKGTSTYCKIPFDKDFFEIVLGGIDSARADEKGLKSVFQPRSSYSSLVDEKPSTRYSLLSTDDKSFFCTMKSSIGKAAQESVRITRGINNFFTPFFSFVVEQLILHDVVLNQESWGRSNKVPIAYNGLKGWNNNCYSGISATSCTEFLDYFSGSGFKELINSAVSGESIITENYTPRGNAISNYLVNHQHNYTNIIYKKNKNICLVPLCQNILSNIYISFGYREPAIVTAKLAIDNVLFTNEDDEKTINYIFSSKDSSTSMSNITFPISSMFTLSTESNLIISRLLNCKSATDYYTLLIETDGKYYKHIESVIQDNHTNTFSQLGGTVSNDQSQPAVRLYTNALLEAFKTSSRVLSSLEAKRNSAK